MGLSIKRKKLVFFVDALSFEVVKHLDNSFHFHELNNVPGYSSNIHWELFQGLKPDDIGFFSDFMFNSGLNNENSRFRNLLDLSMPINNVYRFIKSKFNKKRDNILYSQRRSFSRTGRYFFDSAISNELLVFDELYGLHNKSIENVELESFHVQNDRSIFISNALDYIGHNFGVHSDEYIDMGRNIIGKIKGIIDSVKTHDGVEPQYVIVSDHGMMTVKSSIDIRSSIVKKFGLPGRDYYFFMDSVYIRIWSKDECLLKKISDYLDDVEVLKYIDTDSRVGYGISNKMFGDLIYVLKAGYVFSPNDFDFSMKTQPTGMHGYLEGPSEANGVIASNMVDLSNVRGISQVYSQVSKIEN